MQSLCQFIQSRSTPTQRIPSKSQTSDKVLANPHLTTDFVQKAVITQFYSHIKQADVDSPKESCPKTLNKTRKILWQYELCQGSSELVSEIKCLFVRYRSQIPFMKLVAIEGQFPEIDKGNSPKSGVRKRLNCGMPFRCVEGNVEGVEGQRKFYKNGSVCGRLSRQMATFTPVS